MNRPDAAPSPAGQRPTDAIVGVRRARVDDAAAFARMLSDPAIYPLVLQMPYGSADQWRARLADSCAPGSPHVVLVAEAGGEVVGSAGLHPVGPSPRQRHVMTMGINVDPGLQGRGIGKLLMQALCDYADNWLGLLKIELAVYADNLRAQALYRRFGFVDEGLRRCDALREGVYVDSLLMGRLNPAPLRGFPGA